MADQKNNSAVGETEDKKATLISQLTSDPKLMGAFNDKLQSMVGRKSDFIALLPKNIKRRLKALKKLQLQSFQVESKFFEEVHQLENKYSRLYQPLYEKRKQIITATHEPNDDECDYPSEEEEEEEDEDGTKESSVDKSVFNEDTKGIPEFWLTIFKNVECLSVMLQDDDVEILKCLIDVRVEYSKDSENMGFTLIFEFKENDFFNETQLTKQYLLRSQPDEKHPMSYEGPEITKCFGCLITWKDGKKREGDSEKKPSFFDFFSPPQIDESKKGEDSEIEKEETLMTDYETGQFLQGSVIPRAVLFYTGQALEQEDDDDEEFECSEGEDDEDEDYKPPKDGKADCKQQ